MRTPWDTPKTRFYCKECGGEWYYSLVRGDSISEHRCILCGGVLTKTQRFFNFHPPTRNYKRASKKRKKVDDTVYKDVVVAL